jgi:hypothetical protein
VEIAQADRVAGDQAKSEVFDPLGSERRRGSRIDQLAEERAHLVDVALRALVLVAGPEPQIPDVRLHQP